jgi:hypothetical protein
MLDLKNPPAAVSLSFPRRRESSVFSFFWTPAFAGVTAAMPLHLPVQRRAGHPLDLPRGRESFDVTQDREPVERALERRARLFSPLF